MKAAGSGDRSIPEVPRAATVSGLVAAFVTAGLVSWSTPDGNLVVTSVPAVVAGLIVFSAVWWRSRRGESDGL